MAESLEGARLPRLGAESLVIQTKRKEDLLSVGLPRESEAAEGVAYRSIHGPIVHAERERYWLLDTFLERCLPSAFSLVPAREHWNTGDALPAGPGPYGSGFRALGGADKADDSDEEDDSLRPTRPWSDVRCSQEEFVAWIGKRLSWTMNDLVFMPPGPVPLLVRLPRREAIEAMAGLSEAQRDDERRALSEWGRARESVRKVQFEEFSDARSALVRRVANLYDPNDTRCAWGVNAGWDRYDEDGLSRDDVVAIEGPTEITMVYVFRDRFYG